MLKHNHATSLRITTSKHSLNRHPTFYYPITPHPFILQKISSQPKHTRNPSGNLHSGSSTCEQGRARRISARTRRRRRTSTSAGSRVRSRGRHSASLSLDNCNSGQYSGFLSGGGGKRTRRGGDAGCSSGGGFIYIVSLYAPIDPPSSVLFVWGVVREEQLTSRLNSRRNTRRCRCLTRRCRRLTRGSRRTRTSSRRRDSNRKPSSCAYSLQHGNNRRLISSTASRLNTRRDGGSQLIRLLARASEVGDTAPDASNTG